MISILVVALLAAANPPPPTLPDIELERYVGDWFEYARTPNNFQDNRPVRGGERFSPCFDTSVNYRPELFGLVGLVNSCRRVGLTSGEVQDESIPGLAGPVPGSNNARLKVAFGPGFLIPALQLLLGLGADYWIYAVGPINGDGLYDWALVSGPNRDYLFILTREREPPVDQQFVFLLIAEGLGLPVEDLIPGQT